MPTCILQLLCCNPSRFVKDFRSTDKLNTNDQARFTDLKKYGDITMCITGFFGVIRLNHFQEDWGGSDFRSRKWF